MILIAKALNEDKQKFVSIFSSEGETGQKARAASGLPWFDIKPEEEKILSPFSDNLEVKSFEARDENGDIKDNDWSIKLLLKKCEDEQKVPILHSMYGSETGF